MNDQLKEQLTQLLDDAAISWKDWRGLTHDIVDELLIELSRSSKQRAVAFLQTKIDSTDIRGNHGELADKLLAVMEENNAADILMDVTCEQGWTPATREMLLTRFIDQQGLNFELRLFLRDVQKEEDAAAY